MSGRKTAKEFLTQWWCGERRFTREVHRAECLCEATVTKFKRYGESNIRQVYFMLRKSMIDRHAAKITKYECHGCNPKLCRSSMTVEVDFADPRSGRRWCARRGDWACAARVYFSPVWVCTPACRHRDWARGIVSPTVHETECDIRPHSSFGHARRIEPRVRVFGATAAYRSVRSSLVQWTRSAVDLLDQGWLATAVRTDRWSYGPRSASVARTAWILARAVLLASPMEQLVPPTTVLSFSLYVGWWTVVEAGHLSIHSSLPFFWHVLSLSPVRYSRSPE